MNDEPHRKSIVAEIIAIGDELTSGQRLDTNSQWLSQLLGDLGIRPLFHTTVADDLDSNVDAFRIASQRVDLVIATGGLGPTADDLTRESLARAFHRELVLHVPSLERIQAMFATRGTNHAGTKSSASHVSRRQHARAKSSRHGARN